MTYHRYLLNLGFTVAELSPPIFTEYRKGRTPAFLADNRMAILAMAEDHEARLILPPLAEPILLASRSCWLPAGKFQRIHVEDYRRSLPVRAARKPSTHSRACTSGKSCRGCAGNCRGPGATQGLLAPFRALRALAAEGDGFGVQSLPVARTLGALRFLRHAQSRRPYPPGRWGRRFGCRDRENCGLARPDFSRSTARAVVCGRATFLFFAYARERAEAEKTRSR